MPWQAPGMDFSWLTVALVVGWFGLLFVIGMVVKARTERRNKK